MNNSLEAIIIITAFLLYITIFLFGLNVFKNSLENNQILLSTISTSNNCSIIIDSFFSNKAIEYNSEFLCDGQENFVSFEQNLFSKKTFVLTRIIKEKFLEVKINEHYK
jgi:hypothetical protein